MTDKLEGCLCSEVHLNIASSGPTGSFNWNPDCPVHLWTDEMQAQADRAVEMQRLARETRRRVREDERD